jgi:hypothetical protein
MLLVTLPNSTSGDFASLRSSSSFGYETADLIRIARNAYTVAGVETAVKTRLLTEFDDWVNDNSVIE